MGHFALEEWVDFVRNVVDETRGKEMQRHLDMGCKDCGPILQTWKRVHEIIRGDAIYEPPESAIRSVTGAYVIHGLQKVKPPMPLMARLLFDSILSGLPASVRSAGTSARQLLYRANPYEIDVRLEPRNDSEKVALIGQILSHDPTHAVDGISVTLVRSGKILMKSTTNTVGEFQLGFDPEGVLQLRFEPSHGNEFYIPLSESIGTAPDREGSKAALRARKNGRTKKKR